MNTTDLPKKTARASLQKPTSPLQPRDAYPYFLACKPEIETLLRAGHTMYRVWEAYRDASPPFPATYETFRRYCGKHGLTSRRCTEPTATTPTPRKAPTPSRPKPLVNTLVSSKVWPRLSGKPREFIPRTEE
ncbi:MAG: TraK family protein [Deltaproteobacteria bacterium]|nr:TraK family protein [Deltaproteobacteria bacterium]